MPSPDDSTRGPSLLGRLGPGILVAATGVGAGDLLTAGLAGSRLGLTVLWAAWIGALLKWFLNEGIARWQMATGTTLLEGWTWRLGRWVRHLFLLYLLVWSFFTGGALVNACGVAGAGLFPVVDDLRIAKIGWGAVHSLAGAALVLLGGFRLFERMMAVFVGTMFVCVLVTAAGVATDPAGIAAGLLSPTMPAGGLAYVLGVLGGVGGTVTLLSYGYWIREEGRRGVAGLRACRIDLAVGYTLTATFGVAMIVIGSSVDLGGGPTVALELAAQLERVLGPAGRWIFLVGFWGAVFSSLLGVWQSVPYLFADFVRLAPGRRREPGEAIDFTRTRAYRVYLALITLAPLPLLWLSLERAQLTYAVLGSFFMPLLALTLLLMNNRAGWVGRPFRSGWLANGVLLATLLLFLWVALRKLIERAG